MPTDLSKGLARCNLQISKVWYQRIDSTQKLERGSVISTTCMQAVSMSILFHPTFILYLALIEECYTSWVNI